MLTGAALAAAAAGRGRAVESGAARRAAIMAKGAGRGVAGDGAAALLAGIVAATAQPGTFAIAAATEAAAQVVVAAAGGAAAAAALHDRWWKCGIRAPLLPCMCNRGTSAAEWCIDHSGANATGMFQCSAGHCACTMKAVWAEARPHKSGVTGGPPITAFQEPPAP